MPASMKNLLSGLIQGSSGPIKQAPAAELIDLDLRFDNDRVIQRKVSCSDRASAVGARFLAVDGQDQLGTAVNDRRCPIEVRRAIHVPGDAKPCRNAVEITEGFA